MLDAASRERLQPSLLDRLTDEVKALEVEIGRLRRSLLPGLDEAQREVLAELLAPDERPGEVENAELARFGDLGPERVDQLRRLVGLEQRRQLELKTRFVLSPDRLRACVLRDLGWLLNAESVRWREVAGDHPALAAQPDLEDYPRAAASVVNYGIPPLAGRTTLDSEAVARDLERAIRSFEPRLRAGTVKVRPVGEAQAGHALAFDIEAELWGEPVPLRLLLRTLIDLEDGAATVRAAGGA
jgi:type VI secretion system protein ImpF